MSKFKIIFNWLALFVALLTGIILVTVNSVWLYWLNLKMTSVLAPLGLSIHDMLVNYRRLLAYLQLPWIHTLNMPDFPSSASGLKHFAEVKRLFLLNNGLFLITVLPAWRFVRKIKWEHQQWRFIRPFSIAGLVPIVVLMLMVIDFNHFFALFHEVLFRNSDWLFNPLLDPIILVLPESFFAQCFGLAILLFELVMIFGIWRGKSAQRQL